LIARLLGWATAGSTQHMVSRPPSGGFDAILIPGCPSREDGTPSRAQLERAGLAAILWKDGWARNFIVSGSDVHTPYVEAEAIAQAMTVLGVPPERIVLERDALHSDENVYYALLIARSKGFETLAIATHGRIASLLCSVMIQWGHTCSGIAMDEEVLGAFLCPFEARLAALRAPRSPRWVRFEEREARLAERSGRRRPPSLWLYLLYRWLGPIHRPIAPEHAPITWAERQKELGERSAETFAPTL
jgi:DUF218 domain